MDEFCALLPQYALSAYNSLSENDRRNITEIRLRVNGGVSFCIGGKSRRIKEGLFTREDADTLWLKLCRDAPYSKIREQQSGYITFCGYRVGFGGRFSGRDNTLNEASSFCIRIMREIIGCGVKAYRHLFVNGMPVNTLIIAPPGCGKTTLLRDFVRLLSRDGYNITLVDEREEISGLRDGMPILDVGENTDIITGLSKANAVENGIRALSPEVIALDEIGQNDIEALKKAKTLGVTLLATAHGASVGDTLKRIETDFDRYIILEKAGRITAVLNGEGEKCT